ncbi:MAG: NADP-dependent oxidoreductase [Halieaceae bacterium]|jgi:NADPH-dependent curcumin reductase CurA|nr:NADP-dependent oxidoreductase [Halieaceae bacterium]
MNRQFLLNARPVGDLKHSDFKLVDSEMPVPGEGEVLIKVQYLAVEPAMRGWMVNQADYVAPLELGDLMPGNGLGRVIESRHPDFPVGTRVSGGFGWQEYLVSNGRNVRLQKVPDNVAPTSAMSLLGITGLTAYFGLREIGQPREGDTVLVSGAAGATGSVVGQLAKLWGCGNVVGVAGSREKCDWLVNELGFDAAINYREEDPAARVPELCPGGVDIFFDNVGGEILDVALANIADNARLVICGGISRYNTDGAIPGPANYFNLVLRRARMEGFIVLDYLPRFGEALRYLEEQLSQGKLKSRETVTEGFERMPDALMGLFSGENIGKQLVHLAD